MAEAIAFSLIAETYTKDTIGQRIATKLTPRDLTGQRESVTRAEWSAAGAHGLKPEYKVTMFAPDYEGEKILRMEVNGTTQDFGIYRTYRTGDSLELFLELKVGDTNNVVSNT